MTKLEQIEKSIAELDREELEAFSLWFETFQSARWDRQIEKDGASGTLASIANRALANFRSGKTRPL